MGGVYYAVSEHLDVEVDVMEAVKKKPQKQDLNNTNKEKKCNVQVTGSEDLQMLLFILSVKWFVPTKSI